MTEAPAPRTTRFPLGSLFRVLQMGVGFSLMPRLRAAPSVLERRRLLFREARLVASLALLGSLVIWVATPRIEEWFRVAEDSMANFVAVASAPPR